jgi:hypothetical protein
VIANDDDDDDDDDEICSVGGFRDVGGLGRGYRVQLDACGTCRASAAKLMTRSNSRTC